MNKYGSLLNETTGTIGNSQDDEIIVREAAAATDGGDVVSRLGCCRRSTTLLLLYLPIYLLYIVAGSLIFMETEGRLEQEYRIMLRESRATFLENNVCVSDADLESFITEVVSASQRGVLATNNATGESNWSFGQSVFFSSTIVTTIGYGHVHPLSKGGKSFCIAYALLGIPMTFILLNAIAERFMTPTNIFMNFLISRLGHLYQRFTLRVAHLAVICSFTFIILFVLPSFVFAYIERGWGFTDAFYYCFISLTTIGLGDYIPGDSPDQPFRLLYKLFITGYLMFGLCVAVYLLRLYRDIPQLNLGLLLLPSNDIAPSFSLNGYENSNLETTKHLHNEHDNTIVIGCKEEISTTEIP